ncbi:MAG: hypothetical protein DRP29_06180 [Thermodesulfobacteriota bacterium]|nr:MAG: hypothetical protein DRP29_06180 [Thermodesulfobacteriota bacterium]
MTKIFIPVERDKWRFTSHFKTPFGFYRVRGKLEDFHKISPVPVKRKRLIFPVGKFDVFVSGFEAEQILKHSKDAEVISGYFYDGKEDYSLADYVKDFYAQKKRIDGNKNPAEYHLIKVLLNSLYGKFIQMNRGNMSVFLKDSFTGDLVKWGKRYVASGLFNPPVASWITGFCRAGLFAKMKSREKYVTYCDTDSIGLVKGSFPESNRLGGLKVEGKGLATFIREKLYYVLNKKSEIVKKGTHGFWGKPKEFRDMVMAGKDVYTMKRLVKLREAYIQDKNPFTEEIKQRTIGLYTSRKRENSRTIDFLNDFVWLNPIKVRMF